MIQLDVRNVAESQFTQGVAMGLRQLNDTQRLFSHVESLNRQAQQEHKWPYATLQKLMQKEAILALGIDNKYLN